MPGRYIVAGMTERQITPSTAPPGVVEKAAAAELIGISVRTLERYVADGRITPLPYPLYRRQFRLQDIENLKRTGKAVVAQ